TRARRIDDGEERRPAHAGRRSSHLELTALDRLRIAAIDPGPRQVVLRPRLERRQWQARFQVLHDAHRKLKAVACLEIDAPPVEQYLDQLTEDIGVQQRYEMRDLIDTIRFVERAQFRERRRLVVL